MDYCAGGGVPAVAPGGTICTGGGGAFAAGRGDVVRTDGRRGGDVFSVAATGLRCDTDGSGFMMLTGGIDEAEGTLKPGGTGEGPFPVIGAGVAAGAAATVGPDGGVDHAVALRAMKPSNVRSIRLARSRVVSRNRAKVPHACAEQP